MNKQIAFLSFILGLLTLCSNLNAAERPHIILMLADDLGWGDVGYHDSKIETPNIDKLAKSGVQLNQFYAQPVCSPTRGALLTGRYPMRLGLQCGVVRPWAQHGLPLDERTLPQALTEVGYKTAMAGKWHLGHFAPKYLPMQRGFHQQYGHYNGALDYFTHIRDGGHDWHRDDKPNYDKGYSTNLIGEHAVRIIAKHDKTDPLFLYVPFNAPHTPLQAPQEYINRYAHFKNKRRQTYAAMVTCMDDAVGRITSALEKHNFPTEKTLILFCSDNGGVRQLGSNGELRSGKGTLYEGGVRVPAVAVWEGKLKAGTSCNEPLHVVDLYPTLLRLAGAKIDQSKPLDGKDAWQTIANNHKSPHEFILHNVTPFHGAIRIGDWKLIHNGHVRANATEQSKTELWELFNIREDLSEENDIRQKYPKVFQRLKTKLAELETEAAKPNIAPNRPPQEFKTPKVWGHFAEIIQTSSVEKESDSAENSPRMLTRWAKEVKPDSVLQEYPRPQLVRKKWLNLNGHWDFAITGKDDAQPTEFKRKILVPFPVESTLSGITEPVGAAKRVWYRRNIDIPDTWKSNSVILNFGAVDWQADLFVNGKKIGRHKGGYDPFSFDISSALNKTGKNEIIVSVWDPTNGGTQPRGKQFNDPKGIWYTPVTGIWQTVWIEPVSQTSIELLKLVPDVDKSSLRLTTVLRGVKNGVMLKAVAFEKGKQVGEITGPASQELWLPIRNPRLWSPDSPHLYDLKVTLFKGDNKLDEITSYFGMRKIELGKDKRGHNMFLLNGKPLFHYGPLDQGWWPDGLYTAPTDAALKYDIEVTKRLGFNTIRKHVKVEPARWYYHCDKIGLLVWQDMPSGMHHHRGPQHVSAESKTDAIMPEGHAKQFEVELKEMIDDFGSFTSIVMWVPFNEGWGQYDTKRIAKWVKEYDSSRLCNAISGWTDRGVGDMRDIHEYPGPAIENPGPNRAIVLGEFGGLGWPVKNHLWWDKRNWGYRTYTSRDELNKNYQRVVNNLHGLIGQGLAAAIYTQTTDVEGEINGLMTYDRKIIKLNEEALRKLHNSLYKSITHSVETIAGTSEKTPQQWQYHFGDVELGWNKLDFNASKWKSKTAPFQNGSIAHLGTGTRWANQFKKIHLRRIFTVNEKTDNLWISAFQNVGILYVHLNGELIMSLYKPRPTRRHYRHYDISVHAHLLKPGKNIISITAQKNAGLRGIDVGIYTLKMKKEN